MNNEFSSIPHRIATFTWALFKNGLITVAPLLLTIAVFNIIFKIIKGLLEPIHNLVMSSAELIPSWLQWIPHVEVIIVIMGILLLGTLLNIFILRSILLWAEERLAQIPLIRPIYSGMKQLVKSFGAQETGTMQQVVHVKLAQGITTIGFVTGHVPSHLAPNPETPYASVYVPTTPNPTGGFYLMIAQHELIPLKISRQEAMALVMSVGMITPQHKPQ